MKLIVIGSSGSSHIVLNSPYVSSYHAEILLLDNGDILLEDKGSRNGTFLNENKLHPNKEVSIKRGDNIRFADTMLDWNQVPKMKIDTSVKEMRGIGTNFRNRYKLNGEKVSRFHATFKKKSNGKWYIQDHSTNGTNVNGNPIPKEQDFRIKRGDKILCAGVPVGNPCDESKNRWTFSNPRTIVASVFLVLALCLGVKYGLQRCSNHNILPFSDDNDEQMERIMSDKEIYERYKTSTVLLFAGYYYEVTAKDLNLEMLKLPTKVILDGNGKLKDVSHTNEAAMYFGTGFFISSDGKLITNLHIAKPWLFDEKAERLEMAYKQYLQQIANIKYLEDPTIPLGAYVSEVKVEGRLKTIGLIPNGEEFDEENYVKCKVISAGDNPDVDVALIRTVKAKLPEGCTFVNPDSIEVRDSALVVATHIYTMGFPAGIGLQDLKSNKGIQLFGRGGSIIQESTQYSFGFDAASYGGASGSPIFNDKGMLIGVLNAGFTKTQGFNYGIKAKYVKELLDNEK